MRGFLSCAYGLQSSAVTVNTFDVVQLLPALLHLVTVVYVHDGACCVSTGAPKMIPITSPFAIAIDGIVVVSPNKPSVPLGVSGPATATEPFLVTLDTE